jgi:SnoaL-like domain
MSKQHLHSGLAYYTAMGNKDIEGMEKYVHPEVHFSGPLAEVFGKQAVLEAAIKFFHHFTRLQIRAHCEGDDRVMLLLDVECPEPIGTLRTASCLSFAEGLIARIELFFDPRPLLAKKEDIFTEKK